MKENKKKYVNPKYAIEFYKKGYLGLTDALPLYMSLRIEEAKYHNRTYSAPVEKIAELFGISRARAKNIINRSNVYCDMSAGTLAKTGKSRYWKIDTDTGIETDTDVGNKIDTDKPVTGIKTDSAHTQRTLNTKVIDITQRKRTFKKPPPLKNLSIIKTKEIRLRSTTIEEVQGYCTRNYKRWTLNSLLRYFEKEIQLTVDLKQDDYSKARVGVKLWQEIVNQVLGTNWIPGDMDFSIFSMMVRENHLNHCGVVKAFLLFLAWALSNNKSPHLSEMYLSRVSDFVEELRDKNQLIFDEPNYKDYVEEEKI